MKTRRHWPPVTRPGLVLALSLSALAAAPGCGAEGTFDIADLRVQAMGISVGGAGSVASTRKVSISIGLPPPPSGTCHHELPGDLDATVNGHGPTGAGLKVGSQDDGHSFTLGCTGNERYWIEGDFLVPAVAEVLTIKLQQDGGEGDEILAQVTLPPDPPVSVALGAAELDPGSPLAVELLTTPNVLPSDATCWLAWVTSRVDNTSANATVSSTAIDGGVRLNVALAADAPPLPSGPAKLMISTREEDRCHLPAAVSCQGVASCAVHRDLGRALGPFEVSIR